MTMPDTPLPRQPEPPMGAQEPSQSQSQPRPTARQQVREIKDQAVGQARETFRDARDRVASSLGDSKTRMAGQIGGVAEAFRHASQQFRSDDQTRIAGLADTVAGQVDQIANYLRSRDGRAMLDDIDRVARRQPALAIGGALALGILTARFIKSSQRRERISGSGEGGFNGD